MAGEVQIRASLVGRLAEAYQKMAGGIRDANKTIETSTRQAENRAEGFGNQLKKLAIAAGGLAVIYKGNQFIKEAIRLYDEQAKAEAQLTTALGKNSQALLDQANALQKVTLFGDEQTIAAQAMLAAFVKEESQIKAIIPLVQDLATAKRMDLVSAADMVAKTLGGEMNALGRMGIQVDGAVGSSERLASVQAGLARAFAGSAEAAAKAGAGPLQLFVMQMEEIKESLGKSILPAFINLSARIRDFVTELEKSGKLQSIIDGIGTAFVKIADNIGLLIETGKVFFAIWTAGKITAIGNALIAMATTLAANPAFLAMSAVLATVASGYIALNFATNQAEEHAKRNSGQAVVTLDDLKSEKKALEDLISARYKLKQFQGPDADIIFGEEKAKLISQQIRAIQTLNKIEGEGFVNRSADLAAFLKGTEAKIAKMEVAAKAFSPEKRTVPPKIESDELRQSREKEAQRLLQIKEARAREVEELKIALHLEDLENKSAQSADLERLQMWYDERKAKFIAENESTMLLDKVFKARQSSIEDKYIKERTENEDAAKAKTKAIEDEKRAIREASVSQFIDNLSAAAGASKRFVALQKVLAISEATYDTFVSAGKMFKAGSNFPPPLNLVMPWVLSASAVTAGLARIAAIKSAATGADFVTRGPQLMAVGDNPGGRERVQVTPMSSANLNGPQGMSMGDVTININGMSNAGEIADTIQERLLSFAKTRNRAQALQLA